MTGAPATPPSPPAPEKPDRLAAVEARIAYVFRHKSLLEQALRHSSGKSESAPSNERLEFLGDSVLGAIVAQHLYLYHPHWDEGELTRVRSAVVSATSLADASRALGIAEFLEVGKGMSNQERYPQSLLADVFEALVAAIYLDSGFAAAERFILGRLADKISRIATEEVGKNWKSILQQLAQKSWGVTPTYRVLREFGPEHVKRFEVAAVLGAERGEIGRGEGRSKKEAEQRAAEATVRAILGAKADETREQDVIPHAPGLELPLALGVPVIRVSLEEPLPAWPDVTALPLPAVPAARTFPLLEDPTEPPSQTTDLPAAPGT